MSEIWALLTETQLAKNLIVVLFFVGAIVIMISYVIAINQGREISYWPPKIGEKPHSKVIKPDSTTTEKIPIDLTQRISELEKQRGTFSEKSKASGAVFKTRPLPERVRYLLEVKMHFDSKIKNVALSFSGGWAGSSIASVETYLDYLRVLEKTNSRVNLYCDVKELYSVMQEYLEEYTCSPTRDINDIVFLYIQYMASKLEWKFENTPHGPMDLG